MEHEKRAWLVLADGTVLEGVSFGAEGTVIGEVVFTTGMAGYQEVLTDPSYQGQIVAQTYPLIGNYGINHDDNESPETHLKGYIVREWCETPSNFRSAMTIDEYMKKQNVVGISEIDTRHLTKKLRDEGVMNGAVTTEYETCDKSALMEQIKNYEIRDAVAKVSCKEKSEVKSEKGLYKVALWNFGYKRNIVKSLVNRGCDVTVLPYDTKAEEILAMAPDGVLLSNGPGNPAENTAVIAEVKKLMDKKVPMFGICLGHHLAALAQGGETEKMKYGHRGSNQPAKDLAKGIVCITAQNHGYAVKEGSLPEDVAEVTFRNANDNSIEGIRYKNTPCFTVQFHPEAGAAKCDSSYVFDDFIAMMRKEAE